MLESRFDNVIYRLGFAGSRAQARQLVNHGHFTINGRRNDVPSTLLNAGDVIEIREGSRNTTYFKELADFAQGRNAPDWIERDLKKLTGTVKRAPERAEIDANLNEQLVVEFYSR
jgi:small subunit ribosomal protein S4